MSTFPDSVANNLARALTYRLDRHHLLTANVANADTPGYLPVDMHFENLIGEDQPLTGLSRTAEAHLVGFGGQAGQPELFYDPSEQAGLDGNAVSLDREMAKVSENTVQYNAIAKALQKKLAMLRYAVMEGNG
jgi:flagellar basal-body rod protein FlgB